jgi:hypothetical protein
VWEVGASRPHLSVTNWLAPSDRLTDSLTHILIDFTFYQQQRPLHQQHPHRWIAVDRTRLADFLSACLPVCLSVCRSVCLFFNHKLLSNYYSNVLEGLTSYGVVAMHECHTPPKAHLIEGRALTTREDQEGQHPDAHHHHYYYTLDYPLLQVSVPRYMPVSLSLSLFSSTHTNT